MTEFVFPEIITIFHILVVSAFALVLGSFASAMAHRGTIPIFSSDGKPARSSCPHCNTILTARDLVPVFSWLRSGGKCRHCGTRISMMYPIIEISVLTLSLLYLWQYGFGQLTDLGIAMMGFAVLSALCVFDIRHKRLPNVLVGALATLGILYHFLPAHLNAPLGAEILEYAGGGLLYGALALAMALFMQKMLKKPALGMGDVKFFTVSGIWLGISNLAMFCILGGVLGVIFGFIWQKTRHEPTFPFGPALIVAFAWVFILQGSQTF